MTPRPSASPGLPRRPPPSIGANNPRGGFGGFPTRGAPLVPFPRRLALPGDRRRPAQPTTLVVGLGGSPQGGPATLVPSPRRLACPGDRHRAAEPTTLAVGSGGSPQGGNPLCPFTFCSCSCDTGLRAR